MNFRFVVKTRKSGTRSARRSGPIAALCLLIAAAGGCDHRPENLAPDSISIPGQAVFAIAPGDPALPLEVLVMGTGPKDVPDHAARLFPVPGVEVTFEYRAPKTDADAGAGSPPEDGGQPPRAGGAADRRTPVTLIDPSAKADGTAAEKESRGPADKVVATTGEDGRARVMARANPSQIGEWWIRARIKNPLGQDREVFFQILSGVKVVGEAREREGGAGDLTQVALQLYRINAEKSEAEPDSSRDVYFSLIDREQIAAGARLEKPRDETNRDGIAEVKLQLGSRTGPCRVLAKLEAKGDGLDGREILIEYRAVAWTQLVFNLGAGIFLFIIGLRLLAGNLVIQLSSLFNQLTGPFTRNQLLGFWGGAAVGAAFQSSSAVVARLVSFANGGLIAAAGTAGIILGASLGKTLLIQVLAFDFVTLLATPLIGAGAVLLLLPRRLGSRAWGGVLLGGGLVLLGWHFLERTAAGAQLSQNLRAALAGWDPGSGDYRAVTTAWIFLCDAALAMVVTMVLRNSNLAVAAVIAFAGTGLISLEMVVPLILGANLGSAAGILLGSWTRSREARRLALMNTLFQAAGAVWLAVAAFIPAGGGRSLILQVAEWITPGALYHPSPENLAHHLAMLYSFYHLANGILGLAIARWVVLLTQRLIPRDPVKDDIKPYNLDPNLVDAPSLAIEQAAREVRYLAELARKTVAESFDAFRYQDLNLAEQIARQEESLSGIQRDISQYLLRVSENSLSLREASRLACLQAAVGSLGRIGELGERLRDLTARALEEKIAVPEDVLRELNEVYDLVMAQFENVLSQVSRSDRRTEEKAVKIGERLANSASRIESGWLQRARPAEDGSVAIQGAGGVAFMISREAHETLVQVAKHLSHIAERMRVLTG